MSVYLRRDIDYLLAPYSYDQLFLKLPFDYAVEAAARSRVFHTPLETANSYWSQQYVDIDTTVDDLPHALRLGVGPDPRKVDTSGVSYAALVSVAEFSASKTSGAERLHQECRRRVL